MNILQLLLSQYWKEGKKRKNTLHKYSVDNIDKYTRCCKEIKELTHSSYQVGTYIQTKKIKDLWVRAK